MSPHAVLPDILHPLYCSVLWPGQISFIPCTLPSTDPNRFLSTHSWTLTGSVHPLRYPLPFAVLSRTSYGPHQHLDTTSPHKKNSTAHSPKATKSHTDAHRAETLLPPATHRAPGPLLPAAALAAASTASLLPGDRRCHAFPLPLLPLSLLPLPLLPPLLPLPRPQQQAVGHHRHGA